MTDRPAKPGRIGWPNVLTYIDDQGRETVCPPRGARSYRLNIKDLDRYEELARSGALYHPHHTGYRAKMAFGYDRRLYG